MRLRRTDASTEMKRTRTAIGVVAVVALIAVIAGAVLALGRFLLFAGA